jgi:hypothetical protein
MPKLTTITNNWTSGEFSPRLKGRSDIDQFNASADTLRNVVVLKHGGATLRPPLDYVGGIKVHSETARPVDFIFSRDDAYVLMFGHLTMQVIKNGAYIESSPGTRYEIATPYTQAQLEAIDWTQAADTMIITHGSVKTRRLRRFSDTLWVMDETPFSPGAMAETGHRAAITMAIDNVAVGSGRTLTAGANFFCDADEGRRISWAGGEATITAVGSAPAATATATVTTAFGSLSAAANTWLLEGSPLSECTPSDNDPVGKTITLTLNAGGWRTADVGKHVEINAGLVRITAVATDNETEATGKIVTELANSNGAPSDSWVLKGDAWNEFDGYPETCSFYEQRLWLANTSRYPQTKFGSRSGLYLDFTPGPTDDHAVTKTVSSDQVNPINFLCSAVALLAMGYGGEFEARGGIEKPITQQNMQIKLQSEWGSEPNVRPVTVGKTVLFAERGGKALRTFGPVVDGYDGADISVLSEHLLRDGLKCMTYERRPESVVWVVTRDGGLHALTLSPEQRVQAWASGLASGFVEWAVTIPENGRDSTYCLVRRTIGGQTKRYVERLNWDAERGWHDSRIYQTDSPAKATWDGFDHLIGQTVRAHADGIYVGEFVVDADGEITLPRTALTLSAGLGYDATIVARAPEVGTGTGTSQGQAMSTHSVKVRVLDTIGMRCNGDDLPVGKFGALLLDQPPQPFTGLLEVTNYGWDDGESPITLEQVWGYPWTVLALIRGFTVNQG